LFGSSGRLPHVNGQRGWIDEEFRIQRVFKDQTRRFTIDSGTAGLTSRWSWCTTVTPSSRATE
jgi:hypothetical protein